MEFDQSIQWRWKLAVSGAFLFTLSVTPLARVFGFTLVAICALLLVAVIVVAACSILAGEKRKSLAWVALIVVGADIGYLMLPMLMNERG